MVKSVVSSALLSLLVVVGLSGCGSSERADSDRRPHVVATSTILADLTEQVAGDAIKLQGLLQPGADPHIYEPVPADSKALESADLIFYNGYNLEPGLIRLMKSAGSQVKQVAVGETVSPLQLTLHQQKVPDPHVWGDVSNSIRMVERIREELIKLSPGARDRFVTNADNYIETLKQLNYWIQDQVKTIPTNHRKLITTHDAFQYYAHAYKLEVVGTLIGISTEEQPSAQTVQKLVNAVRAAKVPAIFAETTINPALIQTVAQEAPVKLASPSLYSDSIGAPGSPGDSYVKMMESNTCTIVIALGGKCLPFQPQTVAQTPQLSMNRSSIKGSSASTPLPRAIAKAY